MKRFHVHVVVENMEKSVEFYSKLFDQQPTKQRNDYAKWMLDDPRLNFAISAQGHPSGVNHFGFQVDTIEELASSKDRAHRASDGAVLDQGETTCCYANSEKHWTIDPNGLAWEHFHTLSDAVEFGNETSDQTGACCIPVHGSDKSDSTHCCVPSVSLEKTDACCGK